MTPLILSAASGCVLPTAPAATVHIQDGRIAAVGAYHDVPAGLAGLDAGEQVILPGLVDPHVHINEPGRTDWEGFAHATRAAAAGGVTTLVDMPLNSIPATVSVAGFDAKQTRQRRGDPRRRRVLGWRRAGEHAGHQAARGPRCARVQELPVSVRRRRVPERDRTRPPRGAAGPGRPRHAAPGARRVAGAAARGGSRRRSARRTGPGWSTRPMASEMAAIDLLIELARESGARIHVVHLSSPAPLAAIRAARASGVAISCETCPHYLTFDEDHIVAGATAVQVRAADSQPGRSRGPVARTGVRRDRPGRDRSLAGAARPQAPRRRRLPAGLGRHRVAPTRPRGGVDRSVDARPAARIAGTLDGSSARDARGPRTFKGRHRGRPGRRLRAFGIPRSSRSSTRPRCTIVMR